MEEIFQLAQLCAEQLQIFIYRVYVTSFTQKMETACSSETVVSTYKTTRCHIVEDNYLQIDGRRNTNPKTAPDWSTGEYNVHRHFTWL